MPDCSNLCRICLKESENLESMQPLFDANNPRCSEILQQIEECGGIVLKPHNDFPKMICQQCLAYLDTSHKFRAMCQASEHALLDVIIKSELQLESVDGNSHTPTHNEYIELRGEFIDAEDLDDMVEDEGESFCVRYSPMPTEMEDVEDNEQTNLQPVTILGNTDEPQDDDDEDYVPQDDSSTNRSKTKTIGKSLLSQRRAAQKSRKLKKKVKSAVPDGVIRKRGRPRLCALPYKAIKREITEDGEEKFVPGNNRARKKNDDLPTSIMCEICGNIYSKPALLHVHMRRHLEEKPYECEICNKRFAGNSEVRRHMRVHTGEKPYVCRFCGRTFADRSTNIKHERIHTNERPFTCTQCGKSFTYSNVLKNHMLIHTGEKPFPCVPCNKTFSRKHQLEQHCLTLTHQSTMRNLEKLDDIEFLKVC